MKFIVKLLMIGCLVAGLTACESTSEAVEEWFDDDESEAAEEAEEAAVAVEDKPYPNLASVPDRPDTPAIALEAVSMEEGLAADKANARYTDEVLRNQTAQLQAENKRTRTASGKEQVATVSKTPPTNVPQPPPTPRVPPPRPASNEAADTGPPAAVKPSSVAAAQAAPAPATGPRRSKPVDRQVGDSTPAMAAVSQPAPGPRRTATPPPQPVAAKTPQPKPAPAAGQELATAGGPPDPEPLAPQPAPARAQQPTPPPAAAMTARPARPQPVQPAPVPAAAPPVPNGGAAQNGGPAQSTLIATIYFGDGQTGLTDDDRQILRQVRDLHSGSGTTIRVVGHSSMAGGIADPVRRQMINFKVSMDRANAVNHALVALGVPTNQLVVEARGAGVPRYDESTSAGAAGNRRTEIYFER